MSSPNGANTSIITREDTNNSSAKVDEVRNNNPPIIENSPEHSNNTENKSSFIEPSKEDFALPPIMLSPNIAPSLGVEVSTPSANSNLPHTPPPEKKPMPAKEPIPKVAEKEVYTLSDMSELLIQSMISPPRMVPRWSSKVDEELVLAKQLIENAPPLKDGLYAPLSYELMEQMLKVYIYKEGDKRIFHRPPLEGIYASEGWFMKHMEANRHFVTKRPKEAHLFYLPFSSRQLEEALYVPNSHSHKNLVQHLREYVDMISSKYSFWNRTDVLIISLLPAMIGLHPKQNESWKIALELYATRTSKKDSNSEGCLSPRNIRTKSSKPSKRHRRKATFQEENLSLLCRKHARLPSSYPLTTLGQ
ncbi:hypothetical protein RDABS01_040302 [Bienertia sinuspersici]